MERGVWAPSIRAAAPSRLGAPPAPRSSAGGWREHRAQQQVSCVLVAAGLAVGCRFQHAGAAGRPCYQDKLQVAERYSSADWWEHVLNFPFSIVLRRVRSHVLFNVIFAVVLDLVHQVQEIRPPPLTLLSACSAALGLLLVFRTTAAYDRWSAGHRAAREAKYHVQQIRRLARLWMSEEDLAWIDKELQPFPAFLGSFLTGGIAAGALYGRDPREILVDVGEGIFQRLRAMESPSTAEFYKEDRMQGHVSGAFSSVDEMTQLVSVAVPRQYSRHTSRFLTLYICILPFSLIELGHLMPVAVAIISWALLGIEEIGHTLEDPFNSPINPLNIQEYFDQPVGQDPLMSALKPSKGKSRR